MIVSNLFSGLCALLGLFGLGNCDPPPPLPGPFGTALVIAYWPDGKAFGPPSVGYLTCEPDGGTLKDPGAACDVLGASVDPFAPIPSNVACTQIYGGPELMRVQGRYRDETVDAVFARTDGCRITRWELVASHLIPG